MVSVKDCTFGFLAGVTLYPFPCMVPGALANRSTDWLVGYFAGLGSFVLACVALFGWALGRMG